MDTDTLLVFVLAELIRTVVAALWLNAWALKRAVARPDVQAAFVGSLLMGLVRADADPDQKKGLKVLQALLGGMPGAAGGLASLGGNMSPKKALEYGILSALAQRFQGMLAGPAQPPQPGAGQTAPGPQSPPPAKRLFGGKRV